MPVCLPERYHAGSTLVFFLVALSLLRVRKKACLTILNHLPNGFLHLRGGFFSHSERGDPVGGAPPDQGAGTLRRRLHRSVRGAAVEGPTVAHRSRSTPRGTADFDGNQAGILNTFLLLSVPPPKSNPPSRRAALYCHPGRVGQSRGELPPPGQTLRGGGACATSRRRGSRKGSPKGCLRKGGGGCSSRHCPDRQAIRPPRRQRSAAGLETEARGTGGGPGADPAQGARPCG